MAKINFEINRDLDISEIQQYEEIFRALIISGGGTGVKAGRTILHFDQDGKFMGVQLDYWPYRRRKTN